MRARFPHWIIAAGLAAAFAAALYSLLALRMGEGDVYPPSSTFRADPVGAKALFSALENLPGRPVRVERHFRPLDRLAMEPDGRTNDLAHTTVFLLGENPADWNHFGTPARVEAIERAARAGARVVLAFLAIDASPGERKPDGKIDGDDRKTKPGSNPEKSKSRDPKPRARNNAPGAAPPAGDDRKKDGESTIEELMKKVAEREKTLAQRWGIDFRRVEKKASDSKSDGTGGLVVRPAFPAFAAETGKDSLPWHSALDFELAASEQPLWRVMYSRSRQPVLAERDFGAGKLILASDTYFLSNEALFKEANPSALAWLLGDARRVVFDEQMHGTRENPSLMTFVHRYQLTGVVFAFLALALLYIWKNTAPLVPPPSDPGAEGAPPQAGLAADAGLPSLLRRAVGPAQLPQLCYDQWRHAAGGLDGRRRPTPERMKRLSEILSAFGLEKDPAAAYRAMRVALQPEKNHPT